MAFIEPNEGQASWDCQSVFVNWDCQSVFVNSVYQFCQNFPVCHISRNGIMIEKGMASKKSNKDNKGKTIQW